MLGSDNQSQYPYKFELKENKKDHSLIENRSWVSNQQYPSKIQNSQKRDELKTYQKIFLGNSSKVLQVKNPRKYADKENLDNNIGVPSNQSYSYIADPSTRITNDSKITPKNNRHDISNNNPSLLNRKSLKNILQELKPQKHETKPMFNVTINIEPNKTHGIHIHETDDPHMLAEQCCAKNGLSPKYITIIKDFIQVHLNNHMKKVQENIWNIDQDLEKFNHNPSSKDSTLRNPKVTYRKKSINIMEDESFSDYFKINKSNMTQIYSASTTPRNYSANSRNSSKLGKKSEIPNKIKKQTRKIPNLELRIDNEMNNTNTTIDNKLIRSKSALEFDTNDSNKAQIIQQETSQLMQANNITSNQLPQRNYSPHEILKIPTPRTRSVIGSEQNGVAVPTIPSLRLKLLSKQNNNSFHKIVTSNRILTPINHASTLDKEGKGNPLSVKAINNNKTKVFEEKRIEIPKITLSKPGSKTALRYMMQEGLDEEICMDPIPNFESKEEIKPPSNELNNEKCQEQKVEDPSRLKLLQNSHNNDNTCANSDGTTNKNENHEELNEIEVKTKQTENTAEVKKIIKNTLKLEEYKKIPFKDKHEKEDAYNRLKLVVAQQKENKVGFLQEDQKYELTFNPISRLERTNSAIETKKILGFSGVGNDKSPNQLFLGTKKLEPKSKSQNRYLMQYPLSSREELYKDDKQYGIENYQRFEDY